MATNKLAKVIQKHQTVREYANGSGGTYISNLDYITMLAGHVGVSVSAVRKWGHNTRFPAVRHWAKIREFTKLTESEMIEGQLVPRDLE